jgi:hypothetical protein
MRSTASRLVSAMIAVARRCAETVRATPVVLWRASSACARVSVSERRRSTYRSQSSCRRPQVGVNVTGMGSELRPAGVFVPLVTPFDEHDEVDLEALEALAAQVLDEGARGVVALATPASPPS